MRFTLTKEDIRNMNIFIVIGRGIIIVFNATFNNISVISWQSVLLVEETEDPQKTTDLSQFTDTLYYIMLYRVRLAINGVRTRNWWVLIAQLVEHPTTIRIRPRIIYVLGLYYAIHILHWPYRHVCLSLFVGSPVYIYFIIKKNRLHIVSSS